jgi:uracil-DNA glycosylase family 4
METIRQIDPILIIALGGAALQGLTGDPTSITKAREGLFFVHVPGVYKPISYPVIPTFHPSYVLRHGGQEDRGDIDGDTLPIKGPDSPMSLFKKDMVYAKSFANTLRKKYGERK